MLTHLFQYLCGGLLCSVAWATEFSTHEGLQADAGVKSNMHQDDHAFSSQLSSMFRDQFAANDTTGTQWHLDMPILQAVLPELEGSALAKLQALFKFKHEMDSINRYLHAADGARASGEVNKDSSVFGKVDSQLQSHTEPSGAVPGTQPRIHICTCFGQPPCCPWTKAQAEAGRSDQASSKVADADELRHNPKPQPKPPLCTCFGQWPCCPLPFLTADSLTDDQVVDVQKVVEPPSSASTRKATTAHHLPKLCTCFGRFPPCCPLPMRLAEVQDADNSDVSDAEISVAEKVLSAFRAKGCACYSGSGCCPASLEGCNSFSSKATA